MDTEKRKYKIYEKVNEWYDVESFGKGYNSWCNTEPTDAIETEHFEIVKNTDEEEKVKTLNTLEEVKSFIKQNDDINLYMED